MMRRALTALALAGLVLLSACGDDGDDTSSPTTAATGSVPAQTVTSFTGSGSAEFCQLARANNARVQQIGAAAADPEQLDNVLREAAPAVRQAADLAPAEIKGDVDVLADAFEKLLAETAGGAPDLSSIVSAEFQTAAQNVANYGRTVCGITG
jgi:ABC-type transporter Mla subunit MlaD